RDRGALHRGVEAVVGHDRDRYAVPAEAIAIAKVQRGQRHQLIAVDNLPAPVDGEHAIAVAVEGEAQGVTAGDHLLGERVHVRGAAPCVDVAPVGTRGDHAYARAEASEDLGGDLVGRA